MVENFVKSQSPDNEISASKRTGKKGRRSQPKRARKHQKLPTHPTPEPKNGHSYGMGEFLKHFFKLESKAARGKFIFDIRRAPYHYVKKSKQCCCNAVNA